MSGCYLDAYGATGRSPLQDLKQLILAKTEGTPFFMEEVVQTLAEEGILVGERGQYRVESVPTELHISPTVQGVLAARIDRLGLGEKELLHQLAVIGREFPLSLVRQVVTQPEEELYRVLSSLQRKEFLYEQPAFPEVEYRFKHALLAEVYGKAGQAEDGLAVLAEALMVVDNTGERFYEAELYRLKGELTLAQSSVQHLASSVQKEAEECFHKAMAIARKQQAKSLELRAVMSVSRLWQQQGKKKEAHEMLAKLYSWFTEGFDTKDLQEAKALLDELS